MPHAAPASCRDGSSRRPRRSPRPSHSRSLPNAASMWQIHNREVNQAYKHACNGRNSRGARNRTAGMPELLWCNGGTCPRGGDRTAPASPQFSRPELSQAAAGQPLAGPPAARRRRSRAACPGRGAGRRGGSYMRGKAAHVQGMTLCMPCLRAGPLGEVLAASRHCAAQSPSFNPAPFMPGPCSAPPQRAAPSPRTQGCQPAADGRWTPRSGRKACHCCRGAPSAPAACPGGMRRGGGIRGAARPACWLRSAHSWKWRLLRSGAAGRLWCC